jgi:hypothetical protein
MLGPSFETHFLRFAKKCPQDEEEVFAWPRFGSLHAAGSTSPARRSPIGALDRFHFTP